MPAQVEEALFQAGLELVRRESGGEVVELLPASPDLLLLYLFVLYRGSIKSLDIPRLRAHADRVTVLDLLYNVGAQHGHQLHTVKIKMFDSPAISIEENYLTKRVLRGFHDVTTLVRSEEQNHHILKRIKIFVHDKNIIVRLCGALLTTRCCRLSGTRATGWRCSTCGGVSR